MTGPSRIEAARIKDVVIVVPVPVPVPVPVRDEEVLLPQCLNAFGAWRLTPVPLVWRVARAFGKRWGTGRLVPR